MLRAQSKNIKGIKIIAEGDGPNKRNYDVKMTDCKRVTINHRHHCCTVLILKQKLCGGEHRI